jgi:hypothetical protein
MTPKEREGIDEILSRDALPYEPKPGSQSLLAGFLNPLGPLPTTKLQKLCEFSRLETLAWLGALLALAGGRYVGDTMQALIDAIPEGEESALDGGDEFIFAFDLAAIRLGIDPYVIALRPAQLNS